LSNLGDANYQIGEFRKALECFESALKILRSNSSLHEGFLETHLKVASLWNKIGNVNYKLKQYDEAIRCYKKALRTKKDTLGDENHPEVLLIRHNIALVNAKTGYLDQAFDQLDVIYQQEVSKLGAKNVQVAKLTLDMSGVLLKKNNYKCAMELCEYSQEQFRAEGLPPTHHFVRQAKYTLKAINKKNSWLSWIKLPCSRKR